MASVSAEVVFSRFTGPSDYANGSVKVPGPWKRGRPKGSTNRGTKHHNGIVKNSTPAQFEFINVSSESKDINKNSRTLIRKHVKLNKNSQRRNPSVSPINQEEETTQEAVETARQPPIASAIPRLNLPQIGGVDPFDKSPIKMEPYMHDLLSYYTAATWKHFYSLEKAAGFNPMAEYWLPLAFQDAALLHSLIGCAEVYISGYKTVRDGLRGLRHLQAAISIVNQRLVGGTEVVSSGTLAVTAGIAMLEEGAGRHENWRIHMRGLKQLVDICGGIESLYAKPMVLNKIYRADLYGSLDALEPPYFTKSHLLLSSSKPSPSRPFQSLGFNALHQATNLDKKFCHCIHHLEEAMLFWSEHDTNNSSPKNTINNQPNNPTPVKAARARDLLTSIQYTLISNNFSQKLSHDQEEENNNITTAHHGKPLVSEFLRITLILFSLTILDESPPTTSVGKLIGGKFRLVFTELVYLSQDTAGGKLGTDCRLPLPVDFLLWAVFVALSVVRITESAVDTRVGLVGLFVELVSSGCDEVRGWEDGLRLRLRLRMRRYLWVESIHDESFEWLWSEVVEVRRKRVLVPCEIRN
ncbi:hypothetical protein G7Y89_g4592 [Cudoniella acicularis]|uniref:Tachykinin family protein n=1 Tax=Cudoniella acicularis TaxID=354080 RepID=A0A8H4RQL3_9HELO|nr:hypothetical protein G7Y89_g4592 [Cudoniella acicularis]